MNPLELNILIPVNGEVGLATPPCECGDLRGKGAGDCQCGSLAGGGS